MYKRSIRCPRMGFQCIIVRATKITVQGLHIWRDSNGNIITPFIPDRLYETYQRKSNSVVPTQINP